MGNKKQRSTEHHIDELMPLNWKKERRAIIRELVKECVEALASNRMPEFRDRARMLDELGAEEVDKLRQIAYAISE
jgi:hypothetical protein